MSEGEIKQDNNPAAGVDEDNVISLDDARMRQEPAEERFEIEPDQGLGSFSFRAEVHTGPESDREEVKHFLKGEEMGPEVAGATDLANEIRELKVGLTRDEALPEVTRRLAIEGHDILDASAERFAKKLEFPTETPLHEAAHQELVGTKVQAMLADVGGAIKARLEERGIEYSGEYDAPAGIKAA